MFCKNDNFDVEITGMRTKRGIVRLYSNSVVDESINFSENTLSVVISELYIDGNKKYYSNSINIYIGEVHTMLELVMNGEKIYTDWKVDPKSIDLSKYIVCYKNDSGQNVAFAYLCDGDIVVKNVEELKEVLKIISDSVIKIREESLKIKILNYKK